MTTTDNTGPDRPTRTITVDAGLADQLHVAAAMAGVSPRTAYDQALGLYLTVVHAGPGRVMRPLTLGPTVKAVTVRTLPTRTAPPAGLIITVVVTVLLPFVIVPLLRLWA